MALTRRAFYHPAAMEPDDLSGLRELVGDGANEYALVLAQFHYINRIADLLGVKLPLPKLVSRTSWLRGPAIAAMARVMGGFDLSQRSWDGSADALVERLSALAPGASEALRALESTPAVLEIIDSWFVELAERSTLEPSLRAHILEIAKQALPRDENEAIGLHYLPEDPVDAFVFMGTRYAYRVGPAEIAALRGEGFDDEGLLDLAICVAQANAALRLLPLLGVEALLDGLGGSRPECQVGA